MRPKNLVAVNVLRSWLRDAGIECSRSAEPEADLDAVASDGTSVSIEVAFGPVRLTGDLSVSAKEVLGPDPTKAYRALTDLLGYGPSDPPRRGAPLPVNPQTGKPVALKIDDHDFDVAIRHTEVRLSPDPPPEKF